MKKDISKLKEIRLEWSEIIMVFSGLLFFASTAFIASGGNFAVLLTAKTAYLIGLILLFLNK